MPPLIFWALGLLGAAALMRLLARESRRINAELHPQQSRDAQGRHEKIETLEVDPVTGIYRPK
jgi:hypothetical protein